MPVNRRCYNRHSLCIPMVHFNNTQLIEIGIIMENNNSILTTILLSSKEQNELFTALAKAQASYEIAAFDEKNPHFKNKFASYTALVKATRDALCANGLSVNHKTITDYDGKQYMLTKLNHSSGQFDASLVPLKPDKKTDVQGYGSERSYQMRYSYKEIVGVACHDKEDDDGEEAAKQERESNTAKDPRASNVITQQQYNKLHEAISSFTNDGFLEETICEHNKVAEMSDLPAAAYDGALRFIMKNGKV